MFLIPMPAGQWFNLLLGVCAVAYSLVPPRRVKGYRREVALAMRWLGVCLVALSAASFFLR